MNRKSEIISAVLLVVAILAFLVVVLPKIAPTLITSALPAFHIQADDGDADGWPDTCEGYTDYRETASGFEYYFSGSGYGQYYALTEPVGSDTFWQKIKEFFMDVDGFLGTGKGFRIDGTPDTEGESGSGYGYEFCKVDCDDGNDAINPGAIEACNGVDDDCDGTIDEGCAAPSEEGRRAETYDLGQTQTFNQFSETSLNINQNDIVNLAIDGEEHSITVDNIDYMGRTATFIISSDLFSITMLAGEVRQVDLNNDGLKDLEINFIGFAQKGIDVIFKKLAACGNRICEIGENPGNCCVDCGCFPGNECRNNACISTAPAPIIPPETQPPAAQPAPVPVLAPSLPAYIQSSVSKDISEGKSYLIIVSLIVFAVIVSLITKKLIKMKKEKELFWGY